MAQKEPTVTMTAAELAALVDARIAEREAEAARKAQPAPTQPDEPLVVPFQRPPSDPLFEAELVKTLDEDGGDISHAVATFYAKIHGTYQVGTLQINATPVVGLLDLYEAWRRHPVTHELLYEYDERNQIAAYMERLAFLRKSPSKAELIAQRSRELTHSLSHDEELRIAERRVAELRERVS